MHPVAVAVDGRVARVVRGARGARARVRTADAIKDLFQIAQQRLRITRDVYDALVLAHEGACGRVQSAPEINQAINRHQGNALIGDEANFFVGPPPLPGPNDTPQVGPQQAVYYIQYLGGSTNTAPKLYTRPVVRSR